MSHELLLFVSLFPFTVTVPTVDPIPVTSPSQNTIELTPDDIQTELNFTCMTDAEGSFEWMWTKPGVVTEYANANRSSSFMLTPITADSAGTFRCEVTYTTESPTGSKEFTINFQPSKHCAIVCACAYACIRVFICINICIMCIYCT